MELPSFLLFAKWTNLKATLAGAGGTMYQDWKPFSAEEIRQHLGLYILNGLSPSPRVEHKFRPQRDDVVHGSDFVYRAFGGGAERRHRQFKALPRLKPRPHAITYRCQFTLFDAPMDWNRNREERFDV
jgi:hypothetical protein